MSREGGRLEVFVATKGHAFPRDAFEAMLRAVGAEPTFVDHSAAAMLMNPAALRDFDAVLLYDMPGMNFRAPVDHRPEPIAPPRALTKGFAALLAEGKGIVALHHALAGWPAWPAYAEALGRAFLYRPATVRGMARPSSGYRGDVRYRARPATQATRCAGCRSSSSWRTSLICTRYSPARSSRCWCATLRPAPTASSPPATR